ncbi:OmpP1/FadL family transporter [Nitratifractor sp.]
MNRMKKGAALLSLAAATALGAAGYKLPEQSLNSMALGAAYVAHTTGADTAYYNPANMAFLDPESQYVEGALTLVHLPSIDFKGEQLMSVPFPPGYVLIPADASTKVENIPVGHLHYVSPAFGNWRFGLSVTAPGGLSKRWDEKIQKLYAQEFTLKIIEVNPSFSYRINDQWSVGGGIRIVYSDGKVQSDGNLPFPGARFARDMTGDSIDFGYNLALSYRPSDDLQFAVTYRSNVNLTLIGNATIYAGSPTTPIYQGGARVEVPLPATLAIAAAKTFDERLTVELVYERTFWSKYKDLDFNYDVPLPVFDDPIDKSWKDTNTFRLGLTYLYSDRLTLMAGYAYDETPVPDRTLGYELPDSDAHIFSAGFRYKQTENFEWGMAILYDRKKKRTIPLGSNENGIGGTFSKGGALLTTVGFQYRF